MRVWAGVPASQVEALRDGAPLDSGLVAAESDDEQHEYEALLAAAEDGPVVVVAEVADGADAVGIDDVEAWYVDADGSGHLAWFAPQEVEAVIAAAQGSAQR